MAGVDDTVFRMLTEHGEQLNRHGERLNHQEIKLDTLTLVIMGDSEKRFVGLLDRMSKIEEIVAEIAQWRRDLRIGFTVGLTLLGIVGAGVWLPIIGPLLGLIK